MSSAGEKRSDGLNAPDIEFNAAVKARELRFEKVPENEVRFRGHPERESVSGTERKNLPDEVEEDVTYRDAEVRLRITSRVTDAGLERVEKRFEGR